MNRNDSRKKKNLDKPSGGITTDEHGNVDLIVLSVRGRAARCRRRGSDEVVMVREASLQDVVPGMILTISPRKQRLHGGLPCLTGDIRASRIDAEALALLPLALENVGLWDPLDEYWGEEGEPVEEWARPIIARGPRPEFEMEQVLPGEDPDDPWGGDPIVRAVELLDDGRRAEAVRALMDICAEDLRCLDAHGHLGLFAFDRRPEKAICHFEAGLRIGELSLGKDFHGVLPWGFVDNRPFLRCLHGYGLCLWRLGRFAEAEGVFERLLWLNPSDNQGARFLIDEVKEGTAWRHRGFE